jgi:hypothetical protein
MLKRCVAPLVLALAWGGFIAGAAAQHELADEFDGTHVALSIERFMGVDYTDFEGPGGSDVSARLLLNASEPVPTSYARFGLDVFLERFSLGLAGGVTSEDVAVLAPRIGYLFGLTPTVGLWLRGGGFYAATGGPDYLGVYAEAMFHWFPFRTISFSLGPTIDVAFASDADDDDADDEDPDYLSIGIPQVGMTVFF